MSITVGQGGFDAINEEVRADGGVKAVRMADLRDAAGKARLGRWVVDKIDAQLRSRGLGHTDLSEDHANREVLVYVMGSEVERLVEAVRHPSAQAANTLRAATSNNSDEVLRQIRALVEGT